MIPNIPVFVSRIVSGKAENFLKISKIKKALYGIESAQNQMNINFLSPTVHGSAGREAPRPRASTPAAGGSRRQSLLHEHPAHASTV